MTKRTADPSPISRNTKPRMEAENLGEPAKSQDKRSVTEIALAALADLPADPQAQDVLADPLSNDSSKAQWLLQNARLDVLQLFLTLSPPVELLIATEQEAMNLSTLVRNLPSDRANVIRLDIALPVHPDSRAMTDMVAGTLNTKPGIFRTVTIAPLGSPKQTAICNAGLFEQVRNLAMIRDDLVLGLQLSPMEDEHAEELASLCSLLPGCAQLRVSATGLPPGCWSQVGAIANADRIGSIHVSANDLSAAGVDGMIPMLRSFKGIQRLAVNMQAAQYHSVANWASVLGELARLSCLRLGGNIGALSVGGLLLGNSLPRLSEFAYYTSGDVDDRSISTFTSQLARTAPRLGHLEVGFPVDVSVLFIGIKDFTSLESLSLASLAHAGANGKPDLGNAYECFKQSRSICSFKQLRYEGVVSNAWSWLNDKDAAPFENVANRNRLQLQSGGFGAGAMGKVAEGLHGWIATDIAQTIVNYVDREAVIQLSSTSKPIRDAAVARGITSAGAQGTDALTYILDTRLASRGQGDDPTLSLHLQQLIEGDLANNRLDERKGKRYLLALPALLDSGVPRRLTGKDGQPSVTSKLLNAICDSSAIGVAQCVEMMNDLHFSPQDQAHMLTTLVYDEAVPENATEDFRQWINGLVYMVHTGRAWPAKLEKLESRDDLKEVLSAVLDMTFDLSHKDIETYALKVLDVLDVLHTHVPHEEVLVFFAYEIATLEVSEQCVESIAGFLKNAQVGAAPFHVLEDHERLEEGVVALQLMRLIGHPFIDRARLLAGHVVNLVRYVKAEDREEMATEVQDLLPDSETLGKLLRDIPKLLGSGMTLEDIARITAMGVILGKLDNQELATIAMRLNADVRTSFLLEVISLMK